MNNTQINFNTFWHTKKKTIDWSDTFWKKKVYTLVEFCVRRYFLKKKKFKLSETTFNGRRKRFYWKYKILFYVHQI